MKDDVAAKLLEPLADEYASTDADRERVRDKLRERLGGNACVGSAPTATSWLARHRLLAGVVGITGTAIIGTLGSVLSAPAATSSSSVIGASPEAALHSSTAPVVALETKQEPATLTAEPLPVRVDTLPSVAAPASAAPPARIEALPPAAAAASAAPPVHAFNNHDENDANHRKSASTRTVTALPPIAAPASAVPRAIDVPRAAQADDDDLVRETRLMASANEALRAGDLRGALERFDEHARAFPSGVLADERAVSRVDVLCRLGRRDDAVTDAERFLRTHPPSPLTRRIESTCAGPRPDAASAGERKNSSP